MTPEWVKLAANKVNIDFVFDSISPTAEKTFIVIDAPNVVNLSVGLESTLTDSNGRARFGCAEPKANIKKTAKGLRAMNPKNLLTWQFDLDTGESRILPYETALLIRQ